MKGSSRQIRFGDVVLVPLAWVKNNKAEYKIRPAVVISREAINAAGYYICLGISSKPCVNEYEIPIKNWQVAGLCKPSKIWLTAPFGITEKQILKVIGTIESQELLQIYRLFTGCI